MILRLYGLALLWLMVDGASKKQILSRSRRQTADLWLDHIRTLLALQNATDYHLCNDIIGCGLVDVIDSGKRKRGKPSKDSIQARPERMNVHPVVKENPDSRLDNMFKMLSLDHVDIPSQSKIASLADLSSFLRRQGLKLGSELYASQNSHILSGTPKVDTNGKNGMKETPNAW